MEMERTVIRQLVRDTGRYVDKEIEVSGWIRSNRDQKSFGFLSINDGTHFNTVQVVYERDSLDNYEEVARYRVGSAVTVKGVLVETPKARQPFEIKAQKVSLEGEAPEDYPIQPKRHTREFLREVAHLRPRTNLFSAVFRIRSLAAWAIHQFFQERGFVYVHTPIITASDAEGAGEMFRVSTLDAQNPPLNDQGGGRFCPGLFWPQDQPYCERAVGGRGFCLGFPGCLYLWPDF
jgi:asparaginyl-tRNA synthetase